MGVSDYLCTLGEKATHISTKAWTSHLSSFIYSAVIKGL